VSRSQKICAETCDDLAPDPGYSQATTAICSLRFVSIKIGLSKAPEIQSCAVISLRRVNASVRSQFQELDRHLIRCPQRIQVPILVSCSVLLTRGMSRHHGSTSQRGTSVGDRFLSRLFSYFERPICFALCLHRHGTVTSKFEFGSMLPHIVQDNADPPSKCDRSPFLASPTGDAKCPGC